MINKDAVQEVVEFCDRSAIRYLRDIALAKYTTFSIGGATPLLLEPSSEEQLQQLLKFFFNQRHPYRILGGGSNVLVPDEGVLEPVIKPGRGFRFLSASGGSLFRLGASMPLMSASRELSDQGYAGLEFAGGIPAVVGGAVRMNAGAHGSEMSAVVRAVECFSERGEKEILAPSDLEFSYRHSALPSGWIVTAVTLEMIASSREKTSALRSEFLAHRKATQPLQLPSAGSVFKNPSPEKTAGMIIEECGLKGLKHGNAVVSCLHANWIVNENRKALAEDVIHLVKEIQGKVREQQGVELHPEVFLWTNAQ